MKRKTYNKSRRESVARQIMLTLQFSRNWWKEVRDGGSTNAPEVAAWREDLALELDRILKQLK